MTRTSHNWNSVPGSFDTLHTGSLFPSDGNAWGIPRLAHAPIAYTPVQMVPYRARLREEKDTQGWAVHFFLDDYRFESVWARPKRALVALRAYKILLTPDFSLYADHPLTVQLWNVYRSRWCGAYWQSLGFQVIPTLSWSTPGSYDFCFVGVAKFSVVAVSNVGIRRAEYGAFARGYQEMVERLSPSRVLVYGGQLEAGLENLVEVCYYVPQARGIRDRAKATT